VSGINFNFDPRKNPDAMAEIISYLERTMPDQIKMYATVAKLTKIKYDAMIKEGFTPTQALELCKTI